MHGINGGIKLTWQHNVTVTDLAKITESQKTANIKQHTLQDCASHHRAHKNTWIAPLERWHEYAPKTC